MTLAVGDVLYNPRTREKYEVTAYTSFPPSKNFDGVVYTELKPLKQEA